MASSAPVKLWQKGYTVHPLIEEYLAGEASLDTRLVEADVLGSIAHAKMLGKIGLLTAEEVAALTTGTGADRGAGRRGAVRGHDGRRGCPHQDRELPAETVGDAGKRIHTARSRNDQVLVDMRLFTRGRVDGADGRPARHDRGAGRLRGARQGYPDAGLHPHAAGDALLGRPLGRRRSRRRCWTTSSSCKTAYAINDQIAARLGGVLRRATCRSTGSMSPTCSASRKVQRNVLYAQDARGKFEGLIVQALAQIMIDLSQAGAGHPALHDLEYDFFRVAPRAEDRQQHHAAEAQSRRDGTGARQGAARSWPARQQILGHGRRAAVRLQHGLPGDEGRLHEGARRHRRVAARCDALTIGGLEPQEAQMRAACSPQLFATDHAYDARAPARRCPSATPTA